MSRKNRNTLADRVIKAAEAALAAQDYVSAARRDPDGKGIRIALARKVTMNSMAASEKLFVDLMPETWVGGPPGLPREVIEDLAACPKPAGGCVTSHGEAGLLRHP